MQPQPLIAVSDVERASRWYQRLLGASSAHGGPEYERLVVDGRLVLQIHASDIDHHHEPFVEPGVPLGNGVALWFATERFDEAVGRAADDAMTVVTDVHVNPNSQQRELWLRDEDGYLVVLADGPV
jgi:catechol 2,3-dioxygenase-like lactoylglutathione lyase family enzyme